MPRDVSALIVQVTGDPAPKPCNRCSDGKGPFLSCIMVSARADSGPLKNFLSCANCFYHYGQTYCSHKHWGAERANRILAARAEGAMPGDLHDDVRLEEQNGEDSFLEHEDANAVDDEKVDGSTAGTPMMPRGVSMNITEAEPGREYTMWPGEGDGQVLRTPALTCSVPDENGQLAPTSGALLPAGYQLDATIPGRPWVCPVRTCRKALCKRTDLGFHFQVCQPDPVWCYFTYQFSTSASTLRPV
jgi:hypothetical protein